MSELKRIYLVVQDWNNDLTVPVKRMRWIASLLELNGFEIVILSPNRRLVAGRPKFRPLGWTDNNADGLVKRAVAQTQYALDVLIQALVIRTNGVDKLPALIIGTVPAIPMAFATRGIARILKAPYVIDLRDAWPQLISDIAEWDDVRGRRFQGRSARTASKLIGDCLSRQLNNTYAAAAGLIVTSERLAESLRGQEIFRQHPIALVRNVFPSYSVVPERSIDTAQERIRKGGPLRVLYAGTVGRAQDLKNVILAAEQVELRGGAVSLRFVGDGAAVSGLIKLAESRGVDAQFFPRKSHEKLMDDYLWADTALVHLREWPGLELTVPSKTYELMRMGIHITAVVGGETASVVEDSGAGDVVVPNDSAALAELWLELIRDPDRIEVSTEGLEWVQAQESLSEESLLQIVTDTNDH